MAITNYQTSLSGATWVDINSQYTQNNLPDLLPDKLSITHASLFNLFNCQIGARGRIFQPEYGSLWHQFLQEPIDDITATQMRISMIQAIAKWEPRIKLDKANTFIVADYQLPGYHVRIAGIDVISGDSINIRFTEQL